MTNTIYGYVRVSTREQNEDRQLMALKEEDLLVIKSVDRLGRRGSRKASPPLGCCGKFELFGEMNMLNIRNEEPGDYEIVEQITRDAFYNLYMPGCVEHYLVHTMRGHEDFIRELDFVLELDGEIVGSIMYTKATLTDEENHVKEILTFGPLCIKPDCQRRGYGKMLIQHSFEKAESMGYDTVVIFGMPSNYVSSGFVSCKKHNICMEGDKFPAAMMVRELKPGVLDGRRWYYKDSPVMAVTVEDANAYDDTLPSKERRYTAAQEEFYIMSHSFVE